MTSPPINSSARPRAGSRKPAACEALRDQTEILFDEDDRCLRVVFGSVEPRVHPAATMQEAEELLERLGFAPLDQNRWRQTRPPIICLDDR